MFFSKKSQPTILWDNLFDLKSDVNLDDFLIETRKLKPKWFRSLERDIDPYTMVGSAKTCPSFAELFDKSYTYVAPCDIELELSKLGYRCVLPHPSFLKLNSHTYLSAEDKKRGTKRQMGELWDENIVNIKFMSNLKLKTTSGKVDTVTFSNFYYDPKSDIRASAGLFTITSNMSHELNINTFIDVSDLKGLETKKIFLEKGYPICMIYFPNGKVKFKKQEFKYIPQKYMHNNYRRKVLEVGKEKNKKCPFH